jgi:hypothetical protein
MLRGSGMTTELDPRDEQDLLALIAALEEETRRPGQPRNLLIKGKVGLDWLQDLLDAGRSGDELRIEELTRGTFRPDGTRRSDGLAAILPLWARGTAVLEALRGIVVVDEDATPVTITVHWEQVPAKLRPAAASLASELVDLYYERPKGGRPRKSQKGI